MQELKYQLLEEVNSDAVAFYFSQWLCQGIFQICTIQIHIERDEKACT